jgi:hypothetical protein
MVGYKSRTVPEIQSTVNECTSKSKHHTRDGQTDTTRKTKQEQTSGRRSHNKRAKYLVGGVGWLFTRMTLDTPSIRIDSENL